MTQAMGKEKIKIGTAALLRCEGACAKSDLVWQPPMQALTKHNRVDRGDGVFATFKCMECGRERLLKDGRERVRAACEGVCRVSDIAMVRPEKALVVHRFSRVIVVQDKEGVVLCQKLLYRCTGCQKDRVWGQLSENVSVVVEGDLRE